MWKIGNAFLTKMKEEEILWLLWSRNLQIMRFVNESKMWDDAILMSAMENISTLL